MRVTSGLRRLAFDRLRKLRVVRPLGPPGADLRTGP